MINYYDFGIRDWVEDRRFQRWVYQGEQALFWTRFQEAHPHQVGNMEEARKILLSIRGDDATLSAEAVHEHVADILVKIGDDGQVKRWFIGKWLFAASVLLVIGIGVASLDWKRFFRDPDPYYARVDAFPKGKMIEVVNRVEAVKLVSLPDGSTVLLKRNARLAYPRRFESSRREVFLLGEAFFEVHKDATRPFFVQVAEMETRVLGTSFSIKAVEGAETAELVVKSGLVEVTVNGDEGAERSSLKPNELLNLDRHQLTTSTKTVANASLIGLPIETENFLFKRTKLQQVFRLLERSYGVKIGFDAEKTAFCTITAQLGDEPVFEKLDMICSVVNARYSAQGTDVKVISGGCD